MNPTRTALCSFLAMELPKGLSCPTPSTSPLTLFSLSSANPVSSAGSIYRPCSAKSPTSFFFLGMVI